MSCANGTPDAIDPASNGMTMVSQCSVCPDLNCFLEVVNTGNKKVCQRVYTTNLNAGTPTQYNNRIPYSGYINAWNGWKEGYGKEIFPLNNMMDCCTGKYPDTTNPTTGNSTNPNCALCWVDGSKECNNAITNWCGQIHDGDVIMGIDPKCQLWTNAHKNDGKYDALVKQICKGNNLKTPFCKAYAELPSVNLDDNIQAYCDNLGAGAIDDDVCGCFLKQPVYDKFFSDLSHDLNTALPHFRTCYFPKCVQSSYKRYLDKQVGTKEVCPSVNTCLVENKINNDGSISGNLIFDQSNKCSFTNDNNQPSPPSPSPNPSPPKPSPPSPDSSQQDDGESWVQKIKDKWNGLSRNESIAVLCVVGVLVCLVFFLLYKLLTK